MQDIRYQAEYPAIYMDLPENPVSGGYQANKVSGPSVGFGQFIRYEVLSVPKFTAILYCICLSEHETCADPDAIQICGNI